MTVDRERLLDPVPRLTLTRVLVILAVVTVYLWGLAGAEVRFRELVDGVPNMLDFLGRLLPPKWKTEPFDLPLIGTTIAMPEIAFAIVETLQMALVGTTVAVVVSLPIGLLAARNTSPHRAIYLGTRFLLNAIRAIPEIIFALVFVAAVGLGPFSGVLALSVGALGVMGKMYAEAIEAIDPQQVLAVTATGATRLQTFVYGVIPQALPVVAAYSIIVFEANIRLATILGLVGAGGVGFLLTKYVALFQYQYLSGAILLIILAATCLDRMSDAIRKRLT